MNLQPLVNMYRPLSAISCKDCGRFTLTNDALKDQDTKTTYCWRCAEVHDPFAGQRLRLASDTQFRSLTERAQNEVRHALGLYVLEILARRK